MALAILTEIGRFLLVVLEVGILLIVAAGALALFCKACLLIVAVPCLIVEAVRDWHRRQIVGEVQAEIQRLREAKEKAEDDAWIMEIMHPAQPERPHHGPFDEYGELSFEEMNVLDPTHPIPVVDDEWLDWTSESDENDTSWSAPLDDSE